MARESRRSPRAPQRDREARATELARILDLPEEIERELAEAPDPDAFVRERLLRLPDRPVEEGAAALPSLAVAGADLWAAAFLAAALGTLYFSTLLPGVSDWGDASKFQYLGKILGIPHPTGYPVYLGVTHLLSWVPVGSLAWRINAFSAVLAMIACVTCFAILRRLDVGRGVSLLCALLLGTNRTLWSQSIIAEVYTLHLAIVALVSYLLIAWSQERKRELLFGATLAIAFAFTHHLSSIWLLPAFGYLMLRTDWRVLVDARWWTGAFLFALLGASTYYYLFWRTAAGGPHLEFHIRNLSDFFAYIRGGQFSKLMFTATGREIFLERGPALFTLLAREHALFLPLQLVGVVSLEQRVRVYLLLLLGGTLFWNLNYEIHDIAVYTIPAHFVLVLFAGVGLERVSSWLGGGLARVGLLAAAVVCLGILTAQNLREVDLSDSRIHERYEAILETLDREAFVMMSAWARDYNDFEALSYYSFGEGWADRDVWFGGYPAEADVVNFLGHGRPFHDPVTARWVDPRLTLYAYSRTYSSRIEGHGIVVDPKGGRLHGLGSRPAADLYNVNVTKDQLFAYTSTGRPYQQRMREWGLLWEDADQLFFEAVAPYTVTFSLPVPAPGRYELRGQATTGPDYGAAAVRVDGGDLGRRLDFYSPAVSVRRFSLGEFEMQGGRVLVAFESAERNASATADFMGFDYFDLIRRQAGEGEKRSP